MFYLQFDDGDSAGVAIGNQFNDGDHRLRLVCSRNCTVELDFNPGPNYEMGLGYDRGAQGQVIPKDCKMAVVRIIDPPSNSALIACTFSGK
jgi:hypothetical protein